MASVGRQTFSIGRFGPVDQVYRRKASTRLAVLEEAAEGRTASYRREILHLQRLLRERQEAEERLLQSKREVEEELEVVWQAATRENQQIWESVLDPQLKTDVLLPGQTRTSNQQPLLSSPPKNPALQEMTMKRSELDNQGTSFDEKHKYGLDYYC